MKIFCKWWRCDQYSAFKHTVPKNSQRCAQKLYILTAIIIHTIVYMSYTYICVQVQVCVHNIRVYRYWMTFKRPVTHYMCWLHKMNMLERTGSILDLSELCDCIHRQGQCSKPYRKKQSALQNDPFVLFIRHCEKSQTREIILPRCRVLHMK